MPEPRCALSDLPATMCAHCRGDDPGLTPIDLATPTPPPPRPRVIPASHIAPAALRRAVAATTSAVPAHGALCVNPRCRPGQTPHPTGGRAHLCSACEDTLRRGLAAIADAWPDLEDALTRRPQHGGEPVKGSPSVGIAIDPAVSDTITTATRTVRRIAARVVLARKITTLPPGVDGEDRSTVPALARWLARSHVPWIVTHTDAHEAARIVEDVQEASWAVHRHAYPSGARRVHVPIRCTEPVHDWADCFDEGPCRRREHWRPCGGDMSAVVVPTASRRPDLTCDSGDPGHVVPVDVWSRPGWARRFNPGAVAALVRAVAG